jgi:hypothetical protein
MMDDKQRQVEEIKARINIALDRGDTIKAMQLGRELRELEGKR